VWWFESPLSHQGIMSCIRDVRDVLRSVALVVTLPLFSL
jgi:hypothetical protein